MYKTSDGLDWDLHIKPPGRDLHLNLGDLWRYRDLVLMLVRRNIVTLYKQTILGPLWYFLQPLLTTVTFVFMFGNLARLSTDGTPQALFYLCGITLWNYFSEVLGNTSRTFIENAGLYGKVYFPRLLLPMAKVIAGLVKFAIQFGLLLGVLFYYHLRAPDTVAPNAWVLITPFLLLLMAGLGLGFGTLTSSLTVKYRDLSFFIVFAVQLLMYATPVIYPMSAIPAHFQAILWLNPLSAILEAFKFAYTGSGQFNLYWLGYSTGFTLLLLLVSILVFNRVERNFLDSI